MNAKKVKAIRRIVNNACKDKELIKQVNSLFFSKSHFKNGGVSLAMPTPTLYRNMKKVYHGMKKTKAFSSNMQVVLRNFSDTGVMIDPIQETNITSQARTYVYMAGSYITIKNYSGGKSTKNAEA